MRGGERLEDGHRVWLGGELQNVEIDSPFYAESHFDIRHSLFGVRHSFFPSDTDPGATETNETGRYSEEEEMAENVLLERRGTTAVITLNRPASYNAFDLEMIAALAEMLVRLARDPGVAGIVCTGAGKVFCAGGDLKWAAAHGGGLAAAFHELASRYHQAILEIRRMPKPVLAAINGSAAGGGFSLALACDFRIIEASAILRQGYTSNGLSIDGGGTFSLTRLLGTARALEIAAFDRPIDARQALDWGMVTEIVESGQALKRSLELIEDLTSRPWTSFAASKKLITDAFDTAFEAQLERERQWLAWCADHPNGREGVAAFQEKRKARYNRSEAQTRS